MRSFLLAVCFLLTAPLWAVAGTRNVYKSFEEAMEHPADVRSLHMVYRQLDSLPDIFDSFPNLEEADFSNNRITYLPPSLFRCSHLKRLTLYMNKITVVPAEMGQLKELEFLSVSHNRLSGGLPEEIGSLIHLQELNASGSELKSLPEGIGKLVALKTLRLQVNKLRTLPASIGNLKALELMDISNNGMRQLPDSIGGLTALRFFYLAGNELNDIPETIGKCSKLQEVDVVNTGVMRLPYAMSELEYLEDIYVDDRTITFYPNPRLGSRQRFHIASLHASPYWLAR